MKPVKDRYSKPYFSITREVGFGVESQDYEAPPTRPETMHSGSKK
jgi:hypothetical protein